MKKYDIAVVGGGFAGVAAALAARRGGAKVVIIEKGGSLGGAATSCLVNPFMPYSTVIDGKKVPLSVGLFKKIHDELEARGAMLHESFLEEELKYILNEMTGKAGVDLLYHACIYEASVTDGTISSVKVATRKGPQEIFADYFIDATGDATLSYLAGCPTTLGREGDNLCQPMTLCFRVGNVDVPKFLKGFGKLKAAHKKSLDNGEFINPREDILFFRTPVPNVIHFNTTRVVKLDPTSAEDLTKAEILARKQVFEIYEFMKKHGDGLEDSFLMMTASEIGVRESRMIVGDYVLTEYDCKALRRFDDAIAACNYDIDIHNPEGSGTSHYYFGAGEYYTIPYRSLIPKGVSNMLVAGRCISSDHAAQASYRIMPVVCCIGEAAGVAAALASKAGVGVRDVKIDALQSTLRENGAFIG